MITHKIGNLLESNEIDVACHQANLFCTFGAGIAAAIRQKFPEVYAADCATKDGDTSKLGSFSIGKIKNPQTSLKWIVNVYSQTGLGGQDRQTSYDAMVEALTTLRDGLEEKRAGYVVGFPYMMGCGLANGDFRIVQAIIESVFLKSKIDVIIYYLPEFANELPKK